MTSQVLTVQSDSAFGRGGLTRALLRSLSTRPGWGPVALRLTLAGVLFPHGAQKLLGWFGGHGFAGTMQFFGSMGLPSPVGASVIVIEFFAPILLLLGLGTRLAALGIVGIMVGAIVTVHAEHGFFMNWFGSQAGEGFEYHLLVIGAGLALACSGSGRLGLDARLAHLGSRHPRGGVAR